MLERCLNLKRRLAAGEVAFGAWHTIPDVATVEAIADAGLDYVIIDAEHSPWSMETLQRAMLAFRGVETVPMIRIPANDPAYIKQVLDIGLEGIMAPMIRDAAEAEALVAACHYPPRGIRGFGPRRASGYGRRGAEYLRASYDGVFVMPQIEDYRSVAGIDAILDVPGIDALAFGPTDLSGTLGRLGQTDHAEVTRYLDELLAKALARGVPAMNGLTVSDEAQEGWIAKGARMVLVSQDISSLINETERLLAAARLRRGLAPRNERRVGY